MLEENKMPETIRTGNRTLNIITPAKFKRILQDLLTRGAFNFVAYVLPICIRKMMH